MAAVPRRRSLIGHTATRTGATRAEESGRDPTDTAPLETTGYTPTAGRELGKDGPLTPGPDGTQTALHAARPKARKPPPADPPAPPSLEPGVISASGLEVVERGRPGRGFEGVADQDCFAMDDPPSEEVRLDPRFVRT